MNEDDAIAAHYEATHDDEPEGAPDPCVQCSRPTWHDTGLCDVCESRARMAGVDLGAL